MTQQTVYYSHGVPWPGSMTPYEQQPGQVTDHYPHINTIKTYSLEVQSIKPLLLQ